MRKIKMLNIDPKKETEKITEFIKNTLKKQDFEKVVIGISGGIDSVTSFYLLKKTIPKENIIIAHLYYFKPENLEPLLKDIPKKNIVNISIKPIVDTFVNQLDIDQSNSPRDTRDTRGTLNTLRLGNIAARVRMIVLFDLAKKENALVCGTENKSEHLLGYFTRFGDEASDFEPIRHLYKTQIYKLASYLGVPKNIIDKKPTAGLWPDQTDEKELGFSYEEADPVLYLYFGKKLTVSEIEKRGLKNAEKVVTWVLKNKFKNEAPYSL